MPGFAEQLRTRAAMKLMRGGFNGFMGFVLTTILAGAVASGPGLPSGLISAACVLGIASLLYQAWFRPRNGRRAPT